MRSRTARRGTENDRASRACRRRAIKINALDIHTRCAWLRLHDDILFKLEERYREKRRARAAEVNGVVATRL